MGAVQPGRSKIHTRPDLWAALALGALLVGAAWARAIPYSLTETLGFVTGALCVYLVIREDIWNFPVGIANNVFFIVLFLDARLYGDAGLQVVYILLAAHGWRQWLHGGQERTELRLRSLKPSAVVWLAAGVVAPGTLLLAGTLRLMGGAAPWLDSLTTVLSLVAQYLLNRKYLQTWYFWITADILYVYLYLIRGLQLTALLYTVFLCMCFLGLAAWRRSLGRSPEAPEVAGSHA